MEGGFISSTPERLNARYTHLNPTKNSASDVWTGLLSPTPTLHHHQQQQQQQKRPPLLPLPITRPYYSLPTRTRGLSCSPTKKKINTNMKKYKPSTTTNPKKEDPKIYLISRTRTDTNVMAPTIPLGPGPNDLPQYVSRALPPPATNSFQLLPKDPNGLTCTVLDLDKFSDSIYTLSPPPSSLPLPKFSLRPKLGCNYSRVSGINSGAAGNLRRL